MYYFFGASVQGIILLLAYLEGVFLSFSLLGRIFAAEIVFVLFFVPLLILSIPNERESRERGVLIGVFSVTLVVLLVLPVFN
jgi:hypothetical protein